MKEYKVVWGFRKMFFRLPIFVHGDCCYVGGHMHVVTKTVFTFSFYLCILFRFTSAFRDE